MNTYLLPICSDVDNIIYKVVAKDLRAAEDKYMKILMDKYIDDEDIDPDTFSEFRGILLDTANVVIGDIYSLDEFE
jgi:hypothetical protein